VLKAITNKHGYDTVGMEVSMKVFREEVYSTYTNTELNEGRGRKVLIGHFTEESDALKAGKGRYVMGSDCPVKKETVTVRIFESFEEFKGSKISDSVESKKLTNEEIEFIKNNL
jgi:hypothetical protein